MDLALEIVDYVPVMGFDLENLLACNSILNLTLITVGFLIVCVTSDSYFLEFWPSNNYLQVRRVPINHERYSSILVNEKPLTHGLGDSYLNLHFLRIRDF